MSEEASLKNNARKFITAETLTDDQAHEERVWSAVRGAFSDRECMGYSHYPLYQKIGENRDEPDIVIADQEWGLTVIEVRPYAVDNIDDITGEDWSLRNQQRDRDDPGRIARKKLQKLISHVEGDRLFRLIGGRSFVALPHIEREEWAGRGLDQKVGGTAILFADDLGKKTLRKRIKNATPLVQPQELNDEQWMHLQGAFGGTTVYQKVSEERTNDTSTRAGVVTELRERLHALDLQQEHIGKEIPPGPQRIRGIAGSGKTVLLCQKAAHMHLKHPDWDIALVFFTRSLYDQIENLTNRWIKRFSGGERETYDPNRLHILHAWGAKNQPGLYGEICRAHGVDKLTPGNIEGRSPTESLGEACTRLLEETEIQAQYDAILIDEGQDLVVDDRLRYKDRQPIYWMAYQALRPVNGQSGSEEGSNSERRRLIWAYDEAQSLDSLKIPQAKELFGDDLSRIVSGTYPGGIQKSEIMSRCYRTPGPILVAAHTLGMGLKRDGSMIAGFTRQEDWEAIGYEVDGSFTASGNEITLMRPDENSPNPVPEIWEGDVIAFNAYESRAAELDAVAEKIRDNIETDGLRPSRDILVITLGQRNWQLRKQMAQALPRHGVDSYTPTALSLNETYPKYPDIDKNKFWHDGGVTVSQIHRAKGNEAEVVYIVGADEIAREESNPTLRNQLFVALTRSKGWAHISGTGEYELYEEIRSVVDSGTMVEFSFSRPSRNMGEVDLADTSGSS